MITWVWTWTIAKRQALRVDDQYLKKVFTAFPEKITTAAATPASDHLFEVRDESKHKLLPEEQARAFHHLVAQLLFLSGRARPDIKTPVAFLTTRVKAPDEDDVEKTSPN